MNLSKIIKYSLIGLFILVFIWFKLDFNSEVPIQNIPTERSELIMAKPYTEKIIYDDIELRKFTTQIVKDCPSGNKACQVNEVFRYVVDNYKYYSDPRDKELIQSPYETMSVKGGDCEDFSILMNSMLENIGLKTYLVLSDNHAYSLVCGIKTDELRKYVDISLLKKYASQDLDGEIIYENDELSLKSSYQKNFIIKPYGVHYFGGKGEEIKSPFINKKFDYSVSFSSPVNFYIVSGEEDYTLLAEGKEFITYPNCNELNTLRAKNTCIIGKDGGIAISNNNNKNVVVDMKLDIYNVYFPPDILGNNTITFYNLNEEKCVVLDGTSGEYGYPGFNPEDLKGQRIAIDSITKEVRYLE
jgi:hypothetical protein